MSNITEFTLPYNSFIGGWIIDENICDDMITQFNNNKDKVKPGLFWNDYKDTEDKSVKHSKDLCLKPNEMIPDYIKALEGCLLKYIEKYNYVKDLAMFGIKNEFNIQYYPPGGGYKKWHFERGNKDLVERVLVFMTYLNDVPQGGTKFFHQGITTPAKKGLTLIWPAEWTHTHCGQITEKYEKYITTGWFEFI